VSAQIVEQTVSSTGVVNSASFGYACPLPLGAQRAFISIPAGGGTRRYRLVLYGAEGSVQVQDGLVFNLQDGQLENGPTTSLTAEPKSEGIVKALGQIESGTSDASATTPVASATVHVTASSNTAASDPTLRFSFRLDDGAWSPYTTKATYDSPTLAPGEHRLEARARHANNAAHIVCDDAYGTAIGILVGNDGKVTIRN